MEKNQKDIVHKDANESIELYADSQLNPMLLVIMLI